MPGGLPAVGSPETGAGPRITVAIPPGEYALEAALVSVGYDCEWTGGWVTRTDTPAVRLRASDALADLAVL